MTLGPDNAGTIKLLPINERVTGLLPKQGRDNVIHNDMNKIQILPIIDRAKGLYA